MATNASRRRKADAAASGDAAGAEALTPARASKPTEARRNVILAAATRRFADSGFEATTVRQIADDVNVLSGSLYHHFATKDEMLHEIVRDPVQQMRDNAIRISQAPYDAEHRLIALILLDLGELTRNQQVHAILANERKFFRVHLEFAYVVKAKKDAYFAWRTVLEDGIKAGLFKSSIDIYLTISTVLRMLSAAADWYKNEDAYISGRVGDYTLDHVIDFYLDHVLSAVRLPARADAPIERKACEELATFRA